jgi:DNA-binding transcriptional ArsR family regulator
MSRGIFRRFLRYILLTLDVWERRGAGGGCIEVEAVREAVTVEQLSEDMELELADLFPKHSDLSWLAVRLLLLLQEGGGRRQGELAGSLGVEAYALSRLLTKLEASHYITRRRDGNDKIVSLTPQEKGNKTTPVV